MSTGELLLIIVAALLIFGPKKLPELGRAVGRTFREFKQATQELVDDQTQEKKTTAQSIASEVSRTSQPEVAQSWASMSAESQPEVHLQSQSGEWQHNDFSTETSGSAKVSSTASGVEGAEKPLDRRLPE